MQLLPRHTQRLAVGRHPVPLLLQLGQIGGGEWCSAASRQPVVRFSDLCFGGSGEMPRLLGQLTSRVRMGMGGGQRVMKDHAVCPTRVAAIVGACTGKVLLILMIAVAALGLALVTPGQAWAIPGAGFGYDIPNETCYTWEAANQVNNQLDLTGYICTAYCNNSAYALYSAFGANAIWWWAYHGGGGVATVAKPNGWYQHLHAQPYTANDPDNPPGTVSGANYYLNNRLGSQVTTTLLAVFQGCETALYAPGHSGDRKYNLCALLTEEKGVDAALGFDTTITVDNGRTLGNRSVVWASNFFDRLRNNGSVLEAAQWATTVYVQTFGTAQGYNSYHIFGNKNLHILPVRWSTS